MHLDSTPSEGKVIAFGPPAHLDAEGEKEASLDYEHVFEVGDVLPIYAEALRQIGQRAAQGKASRSYSPAEIALIQARAHQAQACSTEYRQQLIDAQQSIFQKWAASADLEVRELGQKGLEGLLSEQSSYALPESNLQDQDRFDQD